MPAIVGPVTTLSLPANLAGRGGTRPGSTVRGQTGGFFRAGGGHDVAGGVKAQLGRATAHLGPGGSCRGGERQKTMSPCRSPFLPAQTRDARAFAAKRRA